MALTELLSSVETSCKVGDRWGGGEGAEWITCGRAERFWLLNLETSHKVADGREGLRRGEGQ